MTDFNRRKFLEGSAGVAAAATLGTGGTLWTPSALAQRRSHAAVTIQVSSTGRSGKCSMMESSGLRGRIP